MRRLIISLLVVLSFSNQLYADAFTDDLENARVLIGKAISQHNKTKRSREFGVPPAPAVHNFSPDATYEVYFSPKGGAAAAIINALNNTQETADIAIYSINHPGIQAAIASAEARGVQFRFVCDKTEAGLKNSSTRAFAAAETPMHVQHGTCGGVMHMKLGIFDKHTVALGSFNFTGRGDVKNDEILMIIHGDIDLVDSCQAKFDALWERQK